MLSTGLLGPQLNVLKTCSASCTCQAHRRPQMRQPGQQLTDCHSASSAAMQLLHVLSFKQQLYACLCFAPAAPPNTTTPKQGSILHFAPAQLHLCYMTRHTPCCNKQRNCAVTHNRHRMSHNECHPVCCRCPTALWRSTPSPRVNSAGPHTARCLWSHWMARWWQTAAQSSAGCSQSWMQHSQTAARAAGEHLQQLQQQMVCVDSSVARMAAMLSLLQAQFA